MDWKDQQGIVWAKRPSILGKHVLDELAVEGARSIRSCEERFKRLFAEMPVRIDEDIAGFFVGAWNDSHAVVPLSSFALDLERLYSHVETQYQSFACMRGNWINAKNRSTNFIEQGSPTKAAIGHAARSKKQDLLGATEAFWSIVKEEEYFSSCELTDIGGRDLLRKLMASCAYALPFLSKPAQNPSLLPSPSSISFVLPAHLATNFKLCTVDKSFAFAFDIAHRDVLGLKADAVAGRAFRGSGVGALRIVPSLQNVIGVSKRCIATTGKNQLVPRLLTLLPPVPVESYLPSTRTTTDIPSPTKKPRLTMRRDS